MILKCCFYRRSLFAIFFCTQLSDAFALKKTGTTLRPLNVCLVNISRFERKCLYATEKDDSMDDGINDSLTSDRDDFLTRVRIRNIDPAGIRNNFQIFGFLAPLAQLIDARTGGWGLSYADTSPYSDKTIVGLLFLATNFFFVWAGINLFHANNYVLSASIEVSGLASFYYHWCQIHYGPKRDEVRVSLLIDYITAFITINLTFFEIVLLAIRIFDSTDQNFLLASEPILYGVLGIFCLLGSWAFEYGLPYIILHGFWHIFSAISASSLTH